MLKIKIFFSNERNKKYLGQPFIPDSTEVCRHSSLFLNPSVYLFKSFPIFNMLFKAKDANLSVSFLMTNVWSVKSGYSLTMVEYWSSSKPMQYTHVHLEYMYVHRCSFINMHFITPNIIDGSHFKRKKKPMQCFGRLLGLIIYVLFQLLQVWWSVQKEVRWLP